MRRRFESFQVGMSWPKIVERIQRGEVVKIRPSGGSMVPLIHSKDLVTLEAVNTRSLEVGQIVLAKVKGRFYLHKISALDGERVQISNNHGYVNGWTRRDKVYAQVTDVQ